ncbi:MAG: histidine utilization repressor [Rubrivivax sp.]|nr:histidine utilization repressor [Rubrivivax sp.]MDH5338250.1 histidine utilization repressor [Rubrivivax sp.]
MAPRPATSAYARVKTWLKNGLSRGRWPAGARMPSEAELVDHFGVSRMTVNRALKELQAEGLLERRQGAGTFAVPLTHVASTLTIRDLHEEIEAGGHRHDAGVHLARQEVATPDLAEQLGVQPGDPVFHTLIVHRRDGVPVQSEDRFVNPAAAPDYLGVDFTRTTPTHYLLQVAPIWQAQYHIEASTPTPEEAGLLGIGAREPCLVIVRRTQDRRRPITLARLVHPGTRYTIEGSFNP